MPGATHDWEVWVKNPNNDQIESFIEKVSLTDHPDVSHLSQVVFTLHHTFDVPKRVVTKPPFMIREAG